MTLRPGKKRRTKYGPDSDVSTTQRVYKENLHERLQQALDKECIIKNQFSNF